MSDIEKALRAEIGLLRRHLRRAKDALNLAIKDGFEMTDSEGRDQTDLMVDIHWALIPVKGVGEED